MSRRTGTVPGEALRAAHELAEQRRERAAEAERWAYQVWQDAYGAHEVARDKVKAAHRALSAGSPAQVEVPA